MKERCRKGIPDSLRSKAWQLLSGSYVSMSMNSGRFQKFLTVQADKVCLLDIRKDVNRQYPHHELFTEEKGQGWESCFEGILKFQKHVAIVAHCVF